MYIFGTFQILYLFFYYSYYLILISSSSSSFFFLLLLLLILYSSYPKKNYTSMQMYLFNLHIMHQSQFPRSQYYIKNYLVLIRPALTCSPICIRIKLNVYSQFTTQFCFPHWCWFFWAYVNTAVAPNKWTET